MNQSEIDALKAAVEKLAAVLARKPGVAAVSERSTSAQSENIENGR